MNNELLQSYENIHVCRLHQWEVIAMEVVLWHFLKLQGFSLLFIQILEQEWSTIYFWNRLLVDPITIMELIRCLSFLVVFNFHFSFGGLMYLPISSCWSWSTYRSILLFTYCSGFGISINVHVRVFWLCHLLSIGSWDNKLWIHVSKPPENVYIKQTFEVS